MKSIARKPSPAPIALFARLRILTITAGVVCLAFADGRAARAQFSYTFFPNNTTITGEVSTDFAIVGYASGSYNDDFTRNFQGASSPTVNITGSGTIDNEVDSFNNSVVNVNTGPSGSVSGLVPQDHSTVNMQAGTVAFGLTADFGVINMSGGYISDLEGQGAAINMSGGLVDTLVANTSGDFFGSVNGSCIVTLTGGSAGEADSYNRGILDVKGGNIGTQILASFGGTVNLYGTGLTASLVNANYSFSPGGSTYHFYNLTGALADGTSLNSLPVYVRNDSPGSDGSFGLSSLHLFNSAAAPEPGSVALVAFGGLGTFGLRHRRKCS